MRAIKRIINGCRDLPGYGPHPGTGVLLIVILVGGLAGVDKGGWNGFIFGAAFSFAMTMPMYLHGAYSRGKLYERDQVNLLRKIKDA